MVRSSRQQRKIPLAAGAAKWTSLRIAKLTIEELRMERVQAPEGANGRPNEP